MPSLPTTASVPQLSEFDIEGWYSDKPLENTLVLGKGYSYTLRRHKLCNLQLINCKRLAGSIFDGIVFGVVDVTEKYPFFISEEKLDKLKKYLCNPVVSL